MIFEFTANYTRDMHRHIDDLFAQSKAFLTNRETRLMQSDELVEAYVLHSGKRPDTTALGRLATLILRDELTDNRRNKSQVEEFPFLSDNQYRRRVKGEHQRIDGSGGCEVSIRAAAEIAIDGRDYRVPTRRFEK